MKRDRASVRAKLEQRRQQVRARLAARRAGRPVKRPDPRGRLALLVLLLLLLLAFWCCVGPVEPPEPGESGPGAAVEGQVESPLPALDGQVSGRARPAFAPPPVDLHPWLPAFRLQVAARGPRLASCFVGVARPGSLRWSTLVEPSSGLVSAHSLSPTLGSDPLTAAQRDCVLDVLTEPPYRLVLDKGDAGARTTPSRVATAIEF